MLKPIKYKKAYEILIAKDIQKWYYEIFYKELFELCNTDTVINTDDEIINALKSGIIYYQDGAFYSSKKYFPIRISKALKDIGAKYSQWRKAYLLKKESLPLNVYSVIEMLKANTIERAGAIRAFLTSQLGNISDLMKRLVITTSVETIMQDLQKRVYSNFKNAKIETISPKLSNFRANYIAQRYITNLEFWIKGWTEENIQKMRDTVAQMAIDGKSIQDIKKYIQKMYGIDNRHALFLARNETAIATTSYLAAKYQEEGFTKFKWITNYDGRERPLHHELGEKTHNKWGIDGTNIFRYDDPPIIYEYTTKKGVTTIHKGLPGETYNCRCHMIPVMDKEFINARIRNKK